MGTFTGKITDTPSGKVFHSGNRIELRFSKDGDGAVLTGTPDEFEELTVKLQELIAAATNQRHTTAHRPATQAFRSIPQEIRADEHEKGRVLLSLKNDKGVVFPFSFC